MRNSAFTITATVTLAITMLISGCQENPNTSGASVSSPPPALSSSSESSANHIPSSSQPPGDASAKKPLVVLDPGHNGGNARSPDAVNRQVPAGRGVTKPCNTTGTTTADGYPEHAFNFDVARAVGQILISSEIDVAYTRENDSGVGPCVDRRAEIGNTAKAAAVVSIHADGATARDAHGFHIAYSSPPLNAAQGEPSTSLSRSLRDGMERAGFATSSYIGKSGLSPRNDLAGLNLSTQPTALVECGNMRNPKEAGAMTSAEGRHKYARAIAAGIQQFLGVTPG